MSKVETVCPFCGKTNTVEKFSFSGALAHGLPEIKCSHCSKSWGENLIETGSLAKSAPTQSVGMAELRQRLIELGKVVDAYVARRAAARPAGFNTSGREVEKSDGDVRELLNKALDNGTRIDVAHPEVNTSARFQTVESIGVGERTAHGSGARFIPDGFEGNDVAKAELAKALASGKRVDC
jgi:hypothetical protein